MRVSGAVTCSCKPALSGERSYARGLTYGMYVLLDVPAPSQQR